MEKLLDSDQMKHVFNIQLESVHMSNASCVIHYTLSVGKLYYVCVRYHNMVVKQHLIMDLYINLILMEAQEKKFVGGYFRSTCPEFCYDLHCVYEHFRGSFFFFEQF